VIVAIRNERSKQTMSSFSTEALLREVARLHTQLQRNAVARCCNTTYTQCSILTELGRTGPIPLAALSRRLGLDKSWASRAVEHLAQEGLVEKMPSPTDRRMVRLSLSKQGEQRLEELNQTLNGLSEQVMRHIPERDHANIQQGLSLLLSALQTEVAQGSLSQIENEPVIALPTNLEETGHVLDEHFAHERSTNA
jgi:DNA-binding MarR family transcriptional regulator